MRVRRPMPLALALALLAPAASIPSRAVEADISNYGRIGTASSRPFTLRLDDQTAEAKRFDEDPLLVRTSADDVLRLATDSTFRDDPVVSVCRSSERSAVAHAARKSGYVGYCWSQEEDRVEDSWRPQGISSTSDAYASQTADGTPDGRHGLVVSWYSLREQGSRITLINANANGSALSSYAHVLLVDPSRARDGHVSFRAISHVGGLVWYGDKLYAADSAQGMLVFDMTRLYRIPPSLAIDQIGWDPFGQKYSAYGYDYVLPVQYRYRQPRRGTCGTQTSYTAPPCFSFIGLDRSTTPDSIIAGEHRTAGALRESATRIRLTRWSLNPTDGMLCDGSAAARCGARALREGPVRVRRVYMTPTPRLQGAVSWRNRFVLSQSNSAPGVRPSLYASTPGPGSFRYRSVRVTRPWVQGPEGVTLWRNSTASSTIGRAPRLWSLTEFAHRRVVFSVPFSAVD